MTAEIFSSLFGHTLESQGYKKNKHGFWNAIEKGDNFFDFQKRKDPGFLVSKLKKLKKEEANLKEEVKILGQERTELLTEIDYLKLSLEEASSNWLKLFEFEGMEENGNIDTEWNKIKKLELVQTEGIGIVSFESNRKYNCYLNYSQYKETKQLTLRKNFMQAFIQLMDIFSNNDRTNFFQDLLLNNFQDYFPLQTYSIDGFKKLSEALAHAYSIQSTPEGRTQLLSIISSKFPAKYLPQIFGEKISGRQIHKSRLAAATVGPGYLMSTSKRSVSITIQSLQKLLNFLKMVYRYSVTLYPNQTRDMTKHDSDYFNKKTLVKIKHKLFSDYNYQKVTFLKEWFLNMELQIVLVEQLAMNYSMRIIFYITQNYQHYVKIVQSMVS